MFAARTPHTDGVHTDNMPSCLALQTRPLASGRPLLDIKRYSGYCAVSGDPDTVHARRKFHDLFIARRNEVNTEALRRIGELYAIEAAIRGKPPDERRRVRQEQARPLLDALEI
jgi:transposase